MNKSRSHSMEGRRFTLAALGAGLAYAIARYVIFGTVPAARIPGFVANKALALSATLVLAACLALGPLVRVGLVPGAWLRARRRLGLDAFALSAAHVVLTLVLMSPDVYAKFYDGGGHLGLWGGFAVLAGVATAGLLVPPAVTSLEAVRRAMPPDAWRARAWRTPSRRPPHARGEGSPRARFR